MYASKISVVNSDCRFLDLAPSLYRGAYSLLIAGIAAYILHFLLSDISGSLAAFAQSTDPFSYAAGKVQGASAGFMLLIRVGMVIGIICICIYAWYKGGKVSPAWVMAIILCGFIAVRADYVVNMFGTDNPIANVR